MDRFLGRRQRSRRLRFRQEQKQKQIENPAAPHSKDFRIILARSQALQRGGAAETRLTRRLLVAPRGNRLQAEARPEEDGRGVEVYR